MIHWFRRLAVVALLLCFGVIVLGAYVRLSDAGLGCPDWPGCYGHVGVPTVDTAPAASQVASAYPTRPVVEPHKAWKEMIHRYFASTLGFFIVTLAVLGAVLRWRGERRVPVGFLWGLVGVVAFQGALGAWTVTHRVNPLIVTGHLLGGLTTLSLLLWLVLSSRAQPWRLPPAPRWLAGLAPLALAVLVGQIFLGGWTSTNYAALACTDLPTCNGRWLPETDYRAAYTLWHGDGIDYEFGILDPVARMTIQFTHRLGACVTGLVLGGLAAGLVRLGGVWRRLGVLLAAAVAAQIMLGVLTVHYSLPLALADAHNAGAATLLLVMVGLNFCVARADRAGPHRRAGEAAGRTGPAAPGAVPSAPAGRA